MKSFRTDKDTENSPYAAYQAGPSCRVRIIGPAWLKLFFATMKAYGYYLEDTLVSLMDLKKTSNFKLKKIIEAAVLAFLVHLGKQAGIRGGSCWAKFSFR